MCHHLRAGAPRFSSCDKLVGAFARLPGYHGASAPMILLEAAKPETTMVKRFFDLTRCRLEKRLVHVRRSFTHGTEGVPKSGRVRSVPLIDQAARSLGRPQS